MLVGFLYHEINTLDLRRHPVLAEMIRLLGFKNCPQVKQEKSDQEENQWDLDYAEDFTNEINYEDDNNEMDNEFNDDLGENRDLFEEEDFVQNEANVRRSSRKR